jgi:hypothetical protein
MERINRKYVMRAALLAALFGASLVVGSVASALGHKSQPGKPLRLLAHSAAVPSTAATKAFGVLRRPTTPGDDVRAAAGNGPITHAEWALSPGVGVDVSQARRLGFKSAAKAWLVAGADNACLLFEQRSGDGVSAACAPVDDVKAGRLYVASPQQDGSWRLVGIAPDGADSVTVQLSDGSTTTVGVTDNGYDAELAGRPVSVAFQAADGAHQVSIVSADPNG